MSSPHSPEAADALTIRLLGAFSVEIGGEPMPRLRYRSSQWLLALLILRGPRPVERRSLAAALWPDSEEANALFYLRRSLTDLRRALGASACRLLSPTARALRFDLTDAACDVTAFDAAIAWGEAASLQTAVSLYGGALLEGCEEEWVQEERRTREHAFLSALENGGEQALSAENHAGAAQRFRMLLARDPYRESALCRLMESLAHMGDYAAVTAAFREFRLRLHHEMNAAPNPETLALYQRLCEPPMRANSPPSAAPAAPSSPRRLPYPLTDLIGRENDAAQIAGLLSHTRLLTLTGTGGVGKTRLAIAAGEAASGAFAAGVWFVDLAPLTEGTLLAQTIAGTLDLPEEPGRPLAETLQSHLADKSLALLLDNCEHLRDACARLALSLLEYCPHLRVLATSRQALGVTGERVWHVSPLPLPDTSPDKLRDKNGLSTLMESPAARLFVERAAAADSEFQMQAPDALLVAHICCRLDGIPLALELAAARIRSMGLDLLHARLDDCFRLLTHGSRAALPRQQTLRALLDWSYHLLSLPEQTLLRQLAVFRGGWTLEAAEAVCGPGEEEGKEGEGEEGEKGRKAEQTSDTRTSARIEREQVLALLHSLREQSLVFVEEIEREANRSAARYRLLETVRQYAAEKLTLEELTRVQARHGDYYLRFAADIRPRLAGPEQKSWFAALDGERDNFRAALEVCEREPGDAPRHLLLAAALSYFWWKQGRLREGRTRLEQALARPDIPETMQARMDALNDAGLIAHDQGDMEASERFLEQCLAIARLRGDKTMMAKALNNLGIAAKDREDFAEARRRYEASLEIKREIGELRPIAYALHNLGNVILSQGDLTAAADYYRQSLSLFEQLGDNKATALSLNSQGRLARKQGDYEGALNLHRRSLALGRKFQDTYFIAYRIYDLMELACDLQQWERGARLLGGADGLLASSGMQLPPIDREALMAARTKMQDALGATAFEAAHVAGRLFSCEEAIAFALSE